MPVFAILLLFVSVKAYLSLPVEDNLTAVRSVQHLRTKSSHPIGSNGFVSHNSSSIAPYDNIWNSSKIVDSELFINCKNVERSSMASSNFTTLPFDVYWCKNLMRPYVYNDPRPIFYGFNASLKSTCSSIFKASYSSWVTNSTSKSYWWPVENPPCCDLRCYLELQGFAQVFYWPTPAPTSGVTTMVAANGFTL